MKVLKVEWIDSVGGSGWEFLEEYKSEAARCITYGFLAKENDDSISIVQTFSHRTVNSKDQIDNDITIPKCSITSIYEVTSSGLVPVLEQNLQCFSLSEKLSDHEVPEKLT